ncbi:hypothetical protein GCM10010274_01410 [Streptomyces lavendofoliae]|uniref:Uncharacterized protein n=1 Tax=Streptomyces lavendofoliae TaxID=67314 RepID=A0A918M2A2_9ACTN|nr:hypothetical protein GCM10010274_01410 [Streptomyces lavendofoliae]
MTAPRDRPPSGADERTQLAGWFDLQRSIVRRKCEGLTAEDAHRAVLARSPDAGEPAVNADPPGRGDAHTGTWTRRGCRSTGGSAERAGPGRGGPPGSTRRPGGLTATGVPGGPGAYRDRECPAARRSHQPAAPGESAGALAGTRACLSDLAGLACPGTRVRGVVVGRRCSAVASLRRLASARTGPRSLIRPDPKNKP